MGVNILAKEAELGDARFIAALDASFGRGDPQARSELGALWHDRIEQNPGTVFVAKKEGTRLVGYVALSSSPTEPEQLIEVKYAVASNCEGLDVKDILFAAAGVSIVQVTPVVQSQEQRVLSEQV